MTPQPQERLAQVRTKIIATLGPASREPEVLRSLIEAGVDAFRLNFSHGQHHEHAALLTHIRAVEQSLNRPIAVLADLGGPKIRLGPLPGGEIQCAYGETYTLLSASTDPDSPNILSCTYPDLVSDLKPDDEAIFADGAVAMRVESVQNGQAALRVTLAGRLRSGQGLNLPGTDLRLQSLTDKDLRDLDFLRQHPVEYVGLSFARSASDVKRLRAELQARHMTPRIVTKIEKPQAVADFDAILAETDAIMVARGDLGVEMDVALVPAIQKRIITACHHARVPVITATQMLTSMEQSNRPTRAEASDVFNAVLDGTDAVMLSGETAVGAYPVETVSTMSRIAREAETLLPSLRPDPGPLTRDNWITPITQGMVEAASLACQRLGASLLIVATHSGRTALALSKHRHATPTLALADNPEMARLMTLYWGVTPIHADLLEGNESTLEFALRWACQHKMVESGQRVVFLQGTMPGHPAHNALFVRVVD